MNSKIYKCKSCDAVFEMLGSCDCSPMCKDEPMEELQEKTQDQGQEKHVPVIEKTGTGIKVRVGSVPHPMEEAHHIQWIEVADGNKVYRHFLKAGDKPEADFPVKSDNILVREYCNIHGLWIKK